MANARHAAADAAGTDTIYGSATDGTVCTRLDDASTADATNTGRRLSGDTSNAGAATATAADVPSSDADK